MTCFPRASWWSGILIIKMKLMFEWSKLMSNILNIRVCYKSSFTYFSNHLSVFVIKGFIRKYSQIVISLNSSSHNLDEIENTTTNFHVFFFGSEWDSGDSELNKFPIISLCVAKKGKLQFLLQLGPDFAYFFCLRGIVLFVRPSGHSQQGFLNPPYILWTSYLIPLMLKSSSGNCRLKLRYFWP